MTITIPIKTYSTNEQRRWKPMQRHGKVKKQRNDVAFFLFNRDFPPPPVSVLLVRIAPSVGLDDDNLVGALKAVRDEVAKAIGVDDGKKGGITWKYDQRRGDDYAVEVSVG